MTQCRRIFLTTPPHNIIPEKSFPIDIFKTTEAKIIVKMVYRPSSSGFGQFLFDVKYEGFERDYKPELSTDLGFSIPADCTVYITFEDREIWKWSTEYYAITTKKDLRKKFRKYNLDESNETVSFQAKRDNRPPKKDYFSVNVEILQQDAGEKWLPVSIDPWVLNPRPAD
jgi:hypothetical protein